MEEDTGELVMYRQRLRKEETHFGASKSGWREFFRYHRLIFTKRLETELGNLECWECNKTLTPDEATILLDQGGVIVWCPQCCIRTMEKVEMWRRLLGPRKGTRA